MRWVRRVFDGKLGRTDELLLFTPKGAMKTRCVRRLEGDNAWDVQFLNLCVQSVECDGTEQAAETNNLTRRLVGKRLTGSTSGCPGCVGNGQHLGVPRRN